MSMDGRYPKNAGAIFRVCRMDGKFLLLQNSHFHPPWRSYPKNAGAILVVGFITLVLLLIEQGDK